MATFYVTMDERAIVTYKVEADSIEEAEYYAEYEAGSDSIVDTQPIERSVVGCEIA